MSKLFSKESYDEIEDDVVEEGSYLDNATDDELMEVIETDNLITDAQAAEVEEEVEGLEDGMTVIEGLEKISMLAKVTLKERKRGFTPTEAAAINYSMETISALTGSKKPLLVLDVKSFGTESASKAATAQYISLSSEGFMDILKKVYAAVATTLKRAATATARFYTFTLRARNKQGQIKNTLLRTLSKMKESGTLVPNSSVAGSDIGYVSACMGVSDVFGILAARRANLMALVDNTASVNIQSLAPVLTSDKPKELVTTGVKDIIETHLRGMTVTKDTGGSDLFGKSSTDGWVVYIGKPMSMDGKTALIALHESLVNAINTGDLFQVEWIDNFALYGTTSGELDGVKYPTTVPGLPADTVEGLLGYVEDISESDLKVGLKKLEVMTDALVKGVDLWLKQVLAQGQLREGADGLADFRSKLILNMFSAMASMATFCATPLIQATLNDNAAILAACHASIRSYTIASAAADDGVELTN